MTAQTAYDALAADLADRGVTASQMFGKPILKNVNGKAVACLSGDTVAFKLGADSPAFAEALKLSGAKVFEPAEGRQMKGWVAVPSRHAKKYAKYCAAALDLLG